VASPTVQAMLALHIWPWTAPDSGRAARAHPADGTRQPHVGSAAHRQRTAAQAGLRVSPRTVHKYIPRHLHPGPGQRTTSQRWRTFVRHHAGDLIARGVASDLTRGMQAFAAWMRWLLQRGRRPTVANALRGTPRHDATCLARLSATPSGLAMWSPVTVEVISVDQRSPPDCRPSCTHDPGLATRTTSVDRFDVCPAGAALYWWNRANPHTQGARPLSKGGSRAVPCRRAA
jgi:hypothetical protein